MPFWRVENLVATWAGAGLLRPAPGTWGSLAALPFAWVIITIGGWQLLLAASVGLFFLGWWAAHAFEAASPDKDPSSVVVDEVVGQWVTLLPALLDPVWFFAGFVLFRIADIAKPWPASLADRRLHGGLGIMVDDVLAGAYAAAVLFAARVWLG